MLQKEPRNPHLSVCPHLPSPTLKSGCLPRQGSSHHYYHLYTYLVIMSGRINPIKDIVKTTGLPPHIWPSSRARLTPNLGCNYDLCNDYLFNNFDFDGLYRQWIRIHEKTIAALQCLPAEQVLGQATLVRTPTQLTAMVSIAEAASVSMDEEHCQLLWVMVKLIEKSIRSDGKGYQYFRWKHEISYAEHLSRTLGSGRGMGLGEKNHDEPLMRVLTELKELKEQQKELQHQLEATRKQNDEMLRLLRALAQGSNQHGSPMQINIEEATRSRTTADKSTQKYYTPFSVPLCARKKDGQWFLNVNNYGNESQAFLFLLDWLEAQLGGTSFKASTAFLQYINIGDETNFLERSKDLTAHSLKETSGCWRKKVLRGNVLKIPTVENAKGLPGLGLGEHGPFHNPELSDCLILTAAALWSLFDHSLERMPNCQCTFRAASKDFIQCRSKQDEWFIWHTFSNESLCGGLHCDRNIRIALNAEEAGHRIHTTTPCALGWFAMGRHSPNSTIWNTLHTTAKFKKKKLVKYEVKELQALAQLSVPVAVSPLIGGAVTFSKRHYEIANSIDHESIIAMERAAAIVVLIYDERRGIHLICDGADVIEMCCIQFLRDIGYDTSYLPPFSHSTALLRLQTWYSSNFVSVRGTNITGDHLVRQATRKISGLIKTAKQALERDTTLLYWLLEDILRDSSGQAIKAPQSRHVTWHKLAFAAPPLIFVVGDLDDQFLTLGGTLLRWCTSKNKPNRTFRKLFGLLGKDSVPGGIVGSQEIMKRWFVQAYSYTCTKLVPTTDKVIYGKEPTDAEYTYEALERSKDEATFGDPVFSNCICSHEERKRCLHYIQ